MATILKISSIHFTTLIILVKILLCFKADCTRAQSGFLPRQEMNALRDIAKELGKKDWDFSLNPCDNNTNWNTPKQSGMPIWYNNMVLCNCPYPRSPCHVETIYLKGQDLPGVLPPSLSKLRYLKNIDFTRNYLRGTIPHKWTSLKLESMDFTVNRLSGRIPVYLGNMTSLLSLSLESNEFTGRIPPELGNLSNLTKLVLNANYLTGKSPSQLNNLKKLKQLGLTSNNLTGKLPNFQSWPELVEVDMVASGLQGPLPSNISILTNLTILKIAYLNGRGASRLPVLCNMPNMTRLMLRNCNISGKIPECLSNMKNLQFLDLSFNNFHGEIPNLDGLSKLEFMHLTNNSLTGRIPAWITSKTINNNEIIDLSYNDFNVSSVPPTCPENLNLYRSYRSANTLELGRCLDPCLKDYYYSFHVNCGGPEIKIGKMVFEGDEDLSGPAKFVPNATRNWGTSSSGFFWDTQKEQALHFVEHNKSVIPMNVSELYRTARLSPLSLTYYGRCLANGNYSVTLHFAEITFRNKRSYLSLGRRIFDVYIQGEKKLKDFNIEQEANGVDRPINKTFKIMVTNKILEIRFQHTGKGTTAVPYRGTYGPLISAISVNADFKPPDKRKKIMLIEIVSSLTGLFLILGVISFCFWNHYIGRRIAREKELRGLDLRKGFTYRQIKAATNSFDPANKIGEGGFGCVYKGTLLDGTLIAVKQLTSKSNQGNRGFVNELGMISALQHPNLVKLYGCCIEGSDLLLVYEYMENNSLARALFGPDEHQLDMDWPTRIKICIGIAKGLAYMHEESTLKIVHRDIKAGNVLLDKDLNPKISDFGLAKLDEDEDTHISTRVAGTMGYMAPEYALWGHLTYKADVYSFGIVALEIVTGKFNTKYCPDEEFVCLLDWAYVLHTNGGLMDLVDPKLCSDDLNMDEVDKVIRVALLCTSQSPALRPTMSQVVSILEGDISVHEFNLDPTTHETEDVYHDSTFSHIRGGARIVGVGGGGVL